MHHARIDQLAAGNTVVHRLDSRAKLLATLVFTACVITVAPERITALPVFAVWPVALLILARIPTGFALRQIALAAPFVLVLAVGNLFFSQRSIPIALGPAVWYVDEGLLRCLAILVKFILTILALTALAATTPFDRLLAGLDRLGVPAIFVTQLALVWRYLFLLVNRADHLLGARQSRRLRFLGLRREGRVAAGMIGSLLLGGIDTAGRVAMAMHARGFDGHMPTARPLRFARRDALFVAIQIAHLAVAWTLTGAVR